jgi:hypothetical protein
MPELAFVEAMTLDSTPEDMRLTKDGYLVCRPRIARTGIQLYRGHEVGRPNLAEVRVYRSESEVMHRDAMASLAHKPVTIEHPDVPINADNWADLAVGTLTGEIARDGEFIRVPLMLMDAEAINIVRGGKRQLSVGYTATLAWGDGVTPEGEPYHAMQTAIRANHVAITHTARGGDKLRMGDTGGHMSTRRILIDGIGVEMEERDSQVVERRIADLEKQLGTATADMAALRTKGQGDLATAQTAAATAVTQVQNKDAEIATLKQQLKDAELTPEKLDQMVEERMITRTRAKALLDSVVIAGKGDKDIRRQVVNAKMGDAAKNWNDEQVLSSFNTLQVVAGSGSGSPNTLRHVVDVFENIGASPDARTKAYAEYDTNIQNRWKNAGGRSPTN